MNILNKIKEIEKKKLISYILILGTVLYGFITSLLYLTVSSSLYDVLGSIRVPEDYVLFVLDTENPEFRMSYSISNTGIYDLTEFNIKISADFIFYKKNNNSQIQVSVFSEKERLSIPGLTIAKKEFYAGKEAFITGALENYLDTVNDTLTTRYLFRIEIFGHYFLNLIPFSITIKDFELNDSCPICGVFN